MTMNKRELLVGALRHFITGDGKYILLGEAVVVVLGFGAWFLLSPVVGWIALGAGMLALMYGFHTKWMAEMMERDDDFDGDPWRSAIVGMGILYAITILAGVLSAIILMWLSVETGLPLLIPGYLVIMLVVWYFVWR